MEKLESSSSQQESPVGANDIKEQLEQRLRNSLQTLDIRSTSTAAAVTEQKIQDWASFLYNSMATFPRLYHGPDHVLEVLRYYEKELVSSDADERQDPISILAILFHDIIYYTLDKKLSTQQSTILNDIILEDRGSLMLLPFSKHQNPLVSMVATVFGMNENEPLPNVGMNEFLSALIATQIFTPYLSDKQLLQLVVGIEATVPFRPTNKETGKTLMESLYDRALGAWSMLGSLYHSTAADSFVSHAVNQAVMIAHSDLGVFCDPDPTRFIDSTWRLLPEWFPSLLEPNCCSLEEFQSILILLRTRKVDPALIFPSFQSVPSPEALQQKLECTRRNQDLLNRYLSLRLLTVITILELVALSAAAETPSGVILSLCPLERDLNAVLTDEMEESVWNDELDKILFRVLKDGRRVGYSWDASKSLLSAMLFVAIGGSQGVFKALEHSCVEGHKTNVESPTCLTLIPNYVVFRAARALAAALPNVEFGKICKVVEGWP